MKVAARKIVSSNKVIKHRSHCLLLEVPDAFSIPTHHQNNAPSTTLLARKASFPGATNLAKALLTE